ncbi:MAG: DUF1616 domain-containing protein [Desulfurococcaceae archaeon]
MRLDEETFAVIVAISVVASAISVATIVPRNPEPFTALGILNSEGKIGDYPTSVSVGEPVRLYAFVYNSLGRAALFEVVAKVGNGSIPSESEPLNVTPVWKGYVALCNGANATLPVTVTFDRPFINQTLVFELYVLEENGTWSYTGRYCFLRLNVTGAAQIG